MKLENSDRSKTKIHKHAEITQHIHEQPRGQKRKQMKINKYLETTRSGNKHIKTYRIEQAVLRGKFIAIIAYIMKKEKSNKQPNFIPQGMGWGEELSPDLAKRRK